MKNILKSIQGDRVYDLMPLPFHMAKTKNLVRLAAYQKEKRHIDIKLFIELANRGIK